MFGIPPRFGSQKQAMPKFGDAQRTQGYARNLEGLPDRVLEELLLVHLDSKGKDGVRIEEHVSKSRGYYMRDGDYGAIHVIIQMARDLEAMAKRLKDKPLEERILEYHHDVRNAAAVATKRILEKFDTGFRVLMTSVEARTRFIEQLRQSIEPQLASLEQEETDFMIPKPSTGVKRALKPILDKLFALEQEVLSRASGEPNIETLWTLLPQDMDIVRETERAQVAAFS